MAKQKLFDLVQSMSMSEKRFFKIYSSRHTIGNKNDYVSLFDLIDSFVEYDEKVVKNAAFVKNVSAEKNYLYRLILKSLNAFHVHNSSRTKVYDYLTSAEVLFQKGLYEQGLEIIGKAKKLADEFELLRQRLLINEVEQELLLKSLKYKEAVESIEDDTQQLTKIENLKSLTAITTKGYYENLLKGVVREEKDLEEFKLLLTDSLLSKPELALTERAKLHQISAQLTYNMVAGNNKRVVEFATAILSQYHNNPFLIDYTPVGYVSSLFILGYANFADGNLKETYDVIQLIAESDKYSAVEKSQKALANAFTYKHILQLQLCRKDENIVAKESAINAVETDLEKHRPFINTPQLYDLYFYLALAHFELKNFKTALKYTNHIINDTKFKSREDFLNSVRLFNLIVHFELGNEFTLEYISKSTWNYLKKKNRLFEVERKLIRFFERYQKYQDKGQLSDEWKKLYLDLKEFKSDEFERRAFQYVNYLDWVGEKLEK